MREQKGIPLSELERLTDIPHTTMLRLMNLTDDTSPSFENVMKVVIALEGSLDELTGAKAPGTTETPLSRAYNQLVEEKDKRIEKLEKSLSTQRREKYAVSAALFAVLAVVLFILFIDVTNGGIGFVRY